ncbi:sterol desaturase family protein [Defluviimonas aestuarii]|uniref:sterol desaturase family protein n=1 Tax=Albidovulum aestuarii TaxID=1130726 RepID=UPI00249CAD92|nr:sterol desaturase family protein [Defluviimonas aestuarii]MDI3338525.1 sterol desaturase family protein [Defluviimonas aestuarii]
MERLALMFRHRSILGVAAAIMIGIGIVAGSGIWWLWALALLGIPAQMLNEYNMHRFVFHLPPPERQWQFDLLYRAHYGHHDFPTNRELFFAPDFVVFPALALNFVLVLGILALFGAAWAIPGAAAIVLIGGGTTFLAYEWFHSTAHLPVRKTAVERHVTTLHNQHHFRDFSKWFHVTAGGEIIDRAMGTAIDKDALKSQQRIDFIRTLGMRPDDPRLVAARHRFAGRYGLTEDEITRAARA